MIHSPGPIILDVGSLLGLQQSFPLRWYGLLTGLGFVAAAFLIFSQIKDKATELQKQNLFDLLFWCFIGGIIGARTWFVILSWQYFSHNPLEVFFIWQGGQSIQGAFVGGLLSGVIFYELKKKEAPENLLPKGEVADLIALALPLGQAIGRWGNFFNMEAFGKPSNLPWSLYVPPTLRPEKYLGSQAFHPTFAYESIYLLITTVILFALRKRLKLAPGVLLCIYFVLYSVGRFFLEFLRLDSLLIGPFAAAQVICVITALIAIFISFKLKHNYTAVS